MYTTDHAVLIRKLELMGVSGTILNYSGSYIYILSFRIHKVRINGFISRSISVPSGVSQGDHNCTLLFISYMNDISSVFKYTNFSTYTDDLKLFCIIYN